MDPVVCDSCCTQFPVSGLTEDDCRALRDQHSYQESAEELRMLLKVQEYYRRHPDAEGCIKSDFARLLESDDPEVKDQLYSGVPINQIELPPAEWPESWVEGEDDREVVEYLRHHQFSFRHRLKAVSETIVSLAQSARTVSCPRCHGGRLHVPPDNWDEFTAGDAISSSYLRPHWHSFDTDGTLYIRASWWQADSHSSGQQVISPTEPDYEFWCWLVAQTEYHRLVEESELASIREEWSRRTGRST